MPSPETKRVRPIKEVVKEFDETYIIHCSNGDILDGMVSGGAVRRWLRNTITQDRAALHTSLVAAVEGRKILTPHPDWTEEVKNHNETLDLAITVINSIFKE